VKRQVEEAEMVWTCAALWGSAATQSCLHSHCYGCECGTHFTGSQRIQECITARVTDYSLTSQMQSIWHLRWLFYQSFCGACHRQHHTMGPHRVY